RRGQTRWPAGKGVGRDGAWFAPQNHSLMREQQETERPGSGSEWGGNVRVRYRAGTFTLFCLQTFARRFQIAVGLWAETFRSSATWPSGAPKRRKASDIVAKTAPASPRSLVQKFFERSKTPEPLTNSMQP